MMPTPYYADQSTTLYCGDMREILPALDIRADCCVTDPPYAETSLAWDRWPARWPSIVAEATASMWCFGSLRMYLDRVEEFRAWKLSQDIVWEKHNGSGFAADRFKRVHEHALHWYTGKWSAIAHNTPRTEVAEVSRRIRKTVPHGGHLGELGTGIYDYDGTRLARSVIKAPSVRFRNRHPTEKPVEILAPLIAYACPSDGVILDPFAGSGSTADAARQIGRRSILIEADETYCERIAARMAAPLPAL